MRTRTSILITIGALLGAMMVFLLLFWFAFPRWWPEVVIQYSPSLGHVLRADAYRAQASSHSSISPGLAQFGMLMMRDPSDYQRFEKRLGDGIYQAMIAYDDGMHGPVRSLIINYCDEHLNQSKARAVLWAFSDAGDDNARRIVYRHADTIPQRAETKTLKEQQRRSVP